MMQSVSQVNLTNDESLNYPAYSSPRALRGFTYTDEQSPLPVPCTLPKDGTRHSLITPPTRSYCSSEMGPALGTKVSEAPRKYPVPTDTDDFRALSARDQANVLVNNILNDGADTRATQGIAVAAHVARPTDIVLNTFPKAGTVLLQQMCYQIAVHSGGASEDDPTGMEFEDIIQVVPWVEREHKLKCGPAKTYPRIYKTHLPVGDFAHESKHLVIVRNPCQFAASFLNFLFTPCNPDVQGLPPDPVIQECVDVMTEKFILTPRDGNSGLGGWHLSLLSALADKTNRTLITFYEDITCDIPATVRRIARFMDCNLSDEAVEKVAALCEKDSMASDRRFMGEYEYRALGLPKVLVHAFPDSYKGFKKFGVSQRVNDAIEAINLKAFGVQAYDQLREKVRVEQVKKHGY